MTDTVVCSALKYSSGLVVTGARHFDNVMLSVIRALPDSVTTGTPQQGFIDQRGNFLTRKEAWDIVVKNGQPLDVERNVSTEVLFSEGLY